MHQPLRLRCHSAALVSNYDKLRVRAGSMVGAAVKADGYGLGATQVVKRLWDEGCRDFFVSTWWEAQELSFLPPGSLCVLHGLGPDDEWLPGVRPVLNSTGQIARWRQAHPTSPCDVMVDTGMNRLGITPDELSLLDGLLVHTLHSHLACADEVHPLNAVQLERFKSIRSAGHARRYSLANSAGIYLGREYAFDLVRPGLALYGGTPVPEARDEIREVVALEAQIVQLRMVRSGESVGYNATYVAERDHPVAIINIGYADGYWRAFAGHGQAKFGDIPLPVIGRVSMDLVALDASHAAAREGDWVTLDFSLEAAAAQTGFSQYELLTGLGRRLQRVWS